MNLQRRLKLVSIGLGVTAVFIVVVWAFFRPPAARAGPRVVDAVDLTGQIRGVVAETVFAVRQLGTIKADTPGDEILRRRELVKHMQESCERIAGTVEADDSEWIPVAEALVLLENARELAKLALGKAPTGPVTAREAARAGSLATDPDQTGMTPEAVGIIEGRSSELLAESGQLQEAVRKTAVFAAFSRGAWFGFQARDFLLAFGLIACVVGSLTSWRCGLRLAASPAQVVEDELRLLARTDARLAIDSCYQQSEVFLKLADIILAQAGVHGNDTNGSATTSTTSSTA